MICRTSLLLYDGSPLAFNYRFTLRFRPLQAFRQKEGLAENNALAMNLFDGVYQAHETKPAASFSLKSNLNDEVPYVRFHVQ